MKKEKPIECRPTRWRGRLGYAIANEHLSLCWLLGGGHLASISCRGGHARGVNLLWESNWRAIDPQKYSERKHSKQYGAPPAGQFLSGFTGHALCLGYFGSPSEEETQLGLPLHGEAASRPWTVAGKRTSRVAARLKLRVSAPIAGLTLERNIVLRAGESVACVDETLTNRRNHDTYFQWVQHPTFGPPFLAAGESVCLVPGTCSKTWPLGYEDKCALKDDSEFQWPNAPAENGGVLDISQPFSHGDRGFVAATLLKPDSEFSYIAVLNWRLKLIAGYLFRRADFPWVAIWEENRARAGAPWGGKTQARGMEFGTSPMPVGLQNAIQAGPVFGVPTVRCLPARSHKSVSYCIFVAQVPAAWHAISGISACDGAIVIAGPNSEQPIVLSAKGLNEITSRSAVVSEGQKLSLRHKETPKYE
jgi:hypothetical protein